MNRHYAYAVIIIMLLLTGSVAISAQEQPKPAPKPEVNPPNWYRIDVSLNEFEDGKKINTRAYVLEAEANSNPAMLRLGDRVPVATGTYGTGDDQKLVNMQFQYLDVGLSVDCSVYERSGLLGILISAEQSSIVPNQGAQGNTPQQERWLIKQPVIRQIKMGPNRTFVTPGKPMLITSVDDPARANHKYTLEATVTKINP